MKSKIKKILILLLLTLFFIPSLSTGGSTVYARSSSGGHSSGHTSSHTSSHVTRSPATRNPSMKSPATRTPSNNFNRSVKSPSTRTPSSNFNKSSKSPTTRSQSTNKSNPSMKSPASRSSINHTNNINKSIMKSNEGFHSRSKLYSNPSQYVYNPYRNGFFNYYLMSSMWNTSNRNDLKNSGFDQDKLLKPKETTYWISVKTKDNKSVKVLVTKIQYDQIKVNDKVEVKNGKLFLNSVELKEK